MSNMAPMLAADPNVVASDAQVFFAFNFLEIMSFPLFSGAPALLIVGHSLLAKEISIPMAMLGKHNITHLAHTQIWTKGAAL